MSEELFTTKLRDFTKRRPFIPFIVELVDGNRITVDTPAVAFGGGAAGFISETDGLVGFRCEEVNGMAFLTPEARV